jgi:hypothetical protein
MFKIKCNLTRLGNVNFNVRDFRLPQLRSWRLRSSEMLRGLGWELITDVSEQPLCPISKFQPVLELPNS